MSSRTPGLSLSCLLVVLLPVGLADAEDWPQWRGPDRNGISPESSWTSALRNSRGDLVCRDHRPPAGEQAEQR
jgi:hypothetical protein